MNLGSLFRRVLGAERDKPAAAPAPPSPSVPPAAAPPLDPLAALDVPTVAAWLPPDASRKAVDRYFRLGAVPELPRLSEDAEGIDPLRRRTAEACRRMEREVCGIVAEHVIRRFGYSHSSRMNCIRDVGMVLNWCAFCMLIDDVDLLERHFLRWMRTIFEKLEFPGGSNSATAAFVLLRLEVNARLDSAGRAAMKPYLDRVVSTLSHGHAQ